jgi:hypothetical protein
VHGVNTAGGSAGAFDGNVVVAGNVQLSGALTAKGKTAGHFETDGSQGATAIEAFNLADSDAILSKSSSPNHAAVSGWNDAGGFGLWASSMNPPDPGHPSAGGVGLYAQGATYAAHFKGPVFHEGDHHCTGTLTVDKDIALPAGDCAEEFDVAPAAQADPGTVMVLTESGTLEPSQNAYDKKVAGIVSGAGDYRPGMILDRQGSSENRMPIALMGKVYCKVDAQCGPIEVGDLLTTSPTAGHAMRATDPMKSFGAVIGKALRPLRAGQGLVPVLVALQ